MSNIKSMLWDGIPFEIRQKMDSHYESMMSNIRYFIENEDETFKRFIELGFSEKCIEAIGVLSIFNHYVIGPIRISSKNFLHTHLSAVDVIKVGKLNLNHEEVFLMKKTSDAFDTILTELEINIFCIGLTNIRDILYCLINSRQEDEQKNIQWD